MLTATTGHTGISTPHLATASSSRTHGLRTILIKLAMWPKHRLTSRPQAERATVNNMERECQRRFVPMLAFAGTSASVHRVRSDAFFWASVAKMGGKFDSISCTWGFKSGIRGRRFFAQLSAGYSKCISLLARGPRPWSYEGARPLWNAQRLLWSEQQKLPGF